MLCSFVELLFCSMIQDTKLNMESEIHLILFDYSLQNNLKFGGALVFLFQVCPICAANLGKDALGHFTVQHAHSIKVCLFFYEM